MHLGKLPSMNTVMCLVTAHAHSQICCGRMLLVCHATPACALQMSLVLSWCQLGVAATGMTLKCTMGDAQAVQAFPTHQAMLTAMSFSQEGCYLVQGFSDGVVRTLQNASGSTCTLGRSPCHNCTWPFSSEQSKTVPGAPAVICKYVHHPSTNCLACAFSRQLFAQLCLASAAGGMHLDQRD